MPSYTHPGPASRLAAQALREAAEASEEKQPELMKAALLKAADAFAALGKFWHGV